MPQNENAIDRVFRAAVQRRRRKRNESVAQQVRVSVIQEQIGHKRVIRGVEKESIVPAVSWSDLLSACQDRIKTIPVKIESSNSQP